LNGPEQPPYEINPGDLIQYALDRDFEISELCVIFNYKLGKMTGNNPSGSDIGGDTYRMIYAPVYAYEDYVMQLTRADLSNGDANLLMSDLESYTKLSGMLTYVCESVGGKLDIRLGTADEIISYKMDPKGYSKVFIATRFSAPRILIIYK